MFANQESLNVEQNKALIVAAVMFIERCLEDVRRLGTKPPPGEIETVLFDDFVLPPNFRPFYDLDFAERFLAVLMTVAWKLRAPHPDTLGCVAEEMAFHAIVREAERILREVWEVEEPDVDLDERTEQYSRLDLETFRDGVVDDEDYLLLWSTEHAIAQDLDTNNKFGFGGLRFTEWFDHFYDETWNIHPFANRDGIEGSQPPWSLEEG